MAQDDSETGDSDQQEGGDRTGLAENRTDWAEDRTLLAVERTFAGWLRTALAAIGIGLAFRALFGALEPPWLARGIATIFIALGGVIAIGAERRAGRAFARLESHRVGTPDMPRIRWISYAVVFAASVLIAGLWVLNDGDLTASSAAP